MPVTDQKLKGSLLLSKLTVNDLYLLHF